MATGRQRYSTRQIRCPHQEGIHRPGRLATLADGYILRRNVEDLSEVALRQRVLQKDMTNLELGIELFGEQLSMPLALAPVGLTGMYARRGEVQAARAADRKGVPFTMSSVSVCPIEEVVPAKIGRAHV